MSKTSRTQSVLSRIAAFFSRLDEQMQARRDGREYTDDERWYDEVIRPDLARIGKLCEGRKLPIVATVFWPESGGWGSDLTLCLGENPPLAAIWSYMAGRCHGNFDSLILAILREAQREGRDTSGSIYLRLMKHEPECGPDGDRTSSKPPGRG